MSARYGELRPTIGWDRFGSLGHPSKFQRVWRLAFVTATTSLTGGQANFARCLAVSWAGTLYIHFRGFLPWRNFARCKMHFTSKSCVLQRWQRCCTALQQRASAKVCGVLRGMELQNFRRGRHLYWAGRPSPWASANAVIMVAQCNRADHYIFMLWFVLCFLFLA